MSAFTDPAAIAPTRVVERGRVQQDRVLHVALVIIASLAVIVILAIAAFVVRAALPSFRANGIAWFGNVDDPTLDRQLTQSFTGDPETGEPYTFLRAWPVVLGTLLTTFGALALALPFAIFAATFLALLAPRRLRTAVEPVVGLLAATPSVVFGLFAILAVAPLVERHLLDPATVALYAPIVGLTGANLLLGIVTLTVMIAPLMIAIFTDALRAVPTGWTEGAAALGCDRWRMARRVLLPAIRPAIVAGTSLAAARAFGEAIALSMATGSLAFVPNPLDGRYFFLEPMRTLASSIVDYSEGFDGPDLRANLFAFGAVLLVSTALFTIVARVVTLPLERRFRRDAG